MNTNFVERFKSHGFDCVILEMTSSFIGNYYCGYVRIGKDHPLYEVENLDNFDIDVHGGVTFCESKLQTQDDVDSLWVGFDCAHIFDMTNPKNLDYVREECEKLAKFCAQNK